MADTTLSTPIGSLTRVGRATEARFKRLGILTVEDLLSYIPFRYDDLSKTVSISELVPDSTQTIRVLIEQIKSRRGRSGKSITEAIVVDASGKIKAVWFNQPYLAKTLHAGSEVYLSGKAEKNLWGTSLVSPSWEPVRPAMAGQIHTGRIVPVYSTTADLTSKQIRFLVREAMPFASSLHDALPDWIRRKHGLLGRGAAIAAIHFPDSWDAVRAARRRISWEKLFTLALRNQYIRERRKKEIAPVIHFDEVGTREFVARLPFKLTDAQRRAAWKVIQDMSEPHPMNRLLNGDVGSGKTLVAAIAAANVARAGMQTALMVPTEILARQHYQTLTRLFAGTPVRVELLVSGARAEVRRAIAEGKIDVLVGTHAIIEEKVSLSRLALAIVDEQHRFGVEHRKKLWEKGVRPHLLSMTATPIPRTLALTVYGDLDLSVLDELPPGRTPIATRVMSRGEHDTAEQSIREAVARGEQAFVVCPQIEEGDRAGVASVTSMFQRIRGTLDGIFCGLLHGRLPADERERVMASFVAGKMSVLVSTSVIEVGVDVPNATVMVIEDAERFGMAQLHQFRGRVGRGTDPSLCLLVPGAECSEEGMERLRSVAATRDGFALAERDLELRGPGEFFGTAQSGRGGDASMYFNPALIAETSEAARILLERDPMLLNHPKLQEDIVRTSEDVHFE